MSQSEMPQNESTPTEVQVLKTASTSSRSPLRPASFPVLAQTEDFLLSLIHSGAYLSIESLENTQQVLDQLEKLTRRLKHMKTQLDRFASDNRLQTKEALLTLCQDAREVGLEMTSSCGIVLKAALDEAQELSKQSEHLLKTLIQPLYALQQPLRGAARSSKTIGVSPTVIPISIQDN